MFIQIISIICINLFIVHFLVNKKETQNHKKSTMSMIICLMDHTHSKQVIPRSPDQTTSWANSCSKYYSFSSTNDNPEKNIHTSKSSTVESPLSNFPQRILALLRINHNRINFTKELPGGYVYCSQLYLTKKAKNIWNEMWRWSKHRWSMAAIVKIQQASKAAIYSRSTSIFTMKSQN